jgi:hypothetical protein
LDLNDALCEHYRMKKKMITDWSILLYQVGLDEVDELKELFDV